MLTDVQIKKTKPPAEGMLKLYDGGGLFLAVTAAGGKFWRMRYKKKGVERQLSFGPYPEVGLARARELRDAALASLRAGVVPAGRVRDEEAAAPPPPAPTFEETARRWHAAQSPLWKPHHAADILARFEADVFPKLGAQPVRDIRPPAILEVVRAIEPRSVDIARRVRQRISAVYAFAMAEGLADQDPAAPIIRAIAPHVKGHRAAVIELAPARAMLQAAEAIPAHPIIRLAHRLLVLTAARPGEVQGARWAEFEGLDGAEPLWRIPGPRMKMGREHLVPLAPAAVAVLAAAKQMSQGLSLVFPSTKSSRIPFSDSTLSDLLRRAGYQGHHVPHGWRATFSSVMNERHREDRAVIELMLAHAPSDHVEAAYHRAMHMARRRELAREWAGLILDGAVPADHLLGGARR